MILLFYCRILCFLRVIVSALGNMRKVCIMHNRHQRTVSQAKPVTTASEHEPDRPLYSAVPLFIRVAAHY